MAKGLKGLFRAGSPVIAFVKDAKEDSIDVGLVGAGVGAGLIGTKIAFKKIAFLANLDGKMRGAGAIALGLAAGIAAGYGTKKIDAADGGWQKGLALGFAAGMVGAGVADIATAGMSDMGLQSAGLGDTTDLLLGFGDNLDVEAYEPVPGQVSGADDMTQVPGGGYLSGTSNMEANDYRPIPGQVSGGSRLGTFLS